MAFADLNGDRFDINVGRLERQIVRNALNRYEDELEKSAKKDRELGVPNENANLFLAAINGTGGWGEGIYKKFHEQKELEPTPIEAAAGDVTAEVLLTALAERQVGVALEDLADLGAQERADVWAWTQGAVDAPYPLALARVAFAAPEIDKWASEGPYTMAVRDEDGTFRLHDERAPAPEGSKEGILLGLEEHGEAPARRELALSNYDAWLARQGALTPATEDEPVPA